MISDQEILCALCRSAMWQQPCDLDLSPGISDEQWQRIYMNSVRHGVLALALDGVMRLPKELQPGFNTRIKWGYNAEVIAKRYNAQKATAEKLAAIFAEKGIRTMVMKGIGLSLYYPLPRQRPFGDIDIYLFDKFDEGNRIMSKYGCDVDGSYYRHYEFGFGGFNIENHSCFVETRINDTNKYIESELQAMVSDVRTAPSLKGILLPSPDFNALFLARHASWHFARESIQLRDLCDWALFLNAEIGNIDTTRYMEQLRNSGMERFVSIITDICRMKLGLKAELPVSSHYPELCERVFEDIINYRKPQFKNVSTIKHFILKLKMRIERKWCYDMIVPDSFYGNTLHSVTNYITHPSSIFKK